MTGWYLQLLLALTIYQTFYALGDLVYVISVEIFICLKIYFFCLSDFPPTWLFSVCNFGGDFYLFKNMHVWLCYLTGGDYFSRPFHESASSCYALSVRPDVMDFDETVEFGEFAW